MDVEPRSIRPYVLVTTSFVILGCVAAFFVWWLVYLQAASAPGDAAAHAGVVRRVEFAADVPEGDRAGLERDAATATSGLDPDAREAATARLVAARAAGAPPLLTAIHGLSVKPGFGDAEARERLRAAGRALSRVRRALDPGAADAEDVPLADAAAAEGAAKAWFAWWDSRR
jgi:hypothetical protein